MNNSQHFQEMFRRKVVNYSAVNHGRVQPATPFTAPAFLDTRSRGLGDVYKRQLGYSANIYENRQSFLSDRHKKRVDESE